MNNSNFSIKRGNSGPIGATYDGEGVNFALFSANAERVELCLFLPTGQLEVQRLSLPEREGDIWHGYVEGLKPGAVYGYRVYGPYAPELGHRFNPNKLLLDPYARKTIGKIQWNDSLMGYKVGAAKSDLSFDRRDSANSMPKSVVCVDGPGIALEGRPNISLEETIIYEAHTKGLTAERDDIDAGTRGYFLGLCSEPMLEHLNYLGITSIELLPPQAFVDDQFLIEKNLSNYWGYQTIGFFCPEPRFLSSGDIAEFRTMVSRFHSAGIEVLIDVVYNHTAEGSELGPTMSFRGIDNRSYYKLIPNHQRYYENFTGTGNTLNVDHPMVLRMVMDSLRYWVDIMGVDGFRFDLASVLGREEHGFNRSSAFFKAIQQDPILSRVKMIAEPWDVGPGGYQLGGYPAPFLEWNDKYRDGVRRFWRGEHGLISELAERLVGSATQFDHSNRAPNASVNFLTAHDGFTLEDTVSYEHKHNLDNGENGLDGHNTNHSQNFGVEGKTDDKKILEARNQCKRNMLATLLMSQGTTMLLAGDEIGNTQNGNNNAYCQDNEIGWVNWSDPDLDLLQFVRKLIQMRKSHPILRQRRFLHSNRRAIDGMADLFWRLPDGSKPADAQWHDPTWRTLCVEIRSASGTPEYEVSQDGIFAILNGGGLSEVTLPQVPPNKHWVHIISTSSPDMEPISVSKKTFKVVQNSVEIFALEGIN